ncbi:terminase small subunit [Leuconostoc pseudomesenteroides]|uniref:terminase small subunit n=1 Tax=Leuconostoc pseudomesenteroides TaxID=33968 RepID=UPI001B8B26F4|nr:terminase small subunit [Leuconostoc pseudomesenteroides]MBS0957192.1 terminase small subunit [Leuconostoc pseudomesenteroides]
MKKYEEAQKDFEDDMSLADIAKKYDVSVSTVRSWKSRHWGTGVAKKTQRVAKNVAVQKPTETAIDELSDSELTDKQKAFVLEYLRISNATQAYINVYDVPYEIANKTGPRLLVNVGIQNEIERLRKAKLQELSVGVFDLMEDMVVEARADIGDYIDFGKSNQTVYERDESGEEITNRPETDDDGNPIVYRNSWLQFKDKEKVDTRPIKSIKMGKDGPVVELYDRNKARDKLIDMLKSDRNSAISINIQPFEEDS